MTANLLIVGAGGALGSILRYLCQRQWNTVLFPWGTLLVNFAGCFFAGLLAAVLVKETVDARLPLFAITGFCGGFTTFSAFTVECIQLLQKGQWFLPCFYICASVIGGLLAAFFGFKILM